MLRASQRKLKETELILESNGIASRREIDSLNGNIVRLEELVASSMRTQTEYRARAELAERKLEQDEAALGQERANSMLSRAETMSRFSRGLDVDTRTLTGCNPKLLQLQLEPVTT